VKRAATFWKLEVTSSQASEIGLARAASARRVLGNSVTSLQSITQTDLYFFNRDLSVDERTVLGRALLDSAVQNGEWVEGVGNDVPFTGAEVALRAGVTDPVGQALQRAAELLGVDPFDARSGTRFTISAEAQGPALDAVVRTVVNGLLHNDIVDEVSYGASIVPRFFADGPSSKIEIVAVRGRSNEQLAALSVERGLALDPAELVAVRTYFESIDRDPTDAEIEAIAQTWSEHCSHKTFRALLNWDDGTTVEPLLKQLRRSTDRINAPFVQSAFVDNAGIISFDELFDVAIKVETHNHPSAVEPFGGANTGVGGVIRDVLGVAADPIAVTDILCFGPLDTAVADLPAGVLHPQRIRDGVVAGVADYGNKLGLPTVAGAIVHQEGFTANPLVFCGCIGLRPKGLVLPGPKPGERIVALGGATGRDGIRGATFSSATMDATTGDVAGASVQIGDPIIEKLVGDALREARDASLFTAITDCGAGGFSSAIGEIAAVLGADIELDHAPRKYAGLAPWEVWLSEAQERMVIAVPSANIETLRTVCDSHGVSMADLGAFRSDGQLIVRCGGETLLDLPGAFLHDGRPQRQMTATRTVAPASRDVRNASYIVANGNAVLLQVLGHSDVRSNEDVVRGYDHEILGATIGRPYLGARNDGPSDAAVLAPLRAVSGRGLVIGIGMNCRTGHINAKRMAEAVVDEAMRNVVAVGANPSHVALLDNFSWGDPRRPETLGQLIDAVDGCCVSADRYQAPFVSGKDSLNNEYMTTTGERRSIPPTLVITALGVMENSERLVTSDAKRSGNVLVLVGRSDAEIAEEGLRGSVLDAALGIDGAGVIAGGDEKAPARYRSIYQAIHSGLVRSAHDVSDGGLAVTIAEMCMGGRLGAKVDLGTGLSNERMVSALFSEASGRLVLEVEPTDLDAVCLLTQGWLIGTITDESSVSISMNGDAVIDVTLDRLLDAWRGHVAVGSVDTGQVDAGHVYSDASSTLAPTKDNA
jgi:phosphoribosylformylglycinamidine synthase subunit PurSL